VVPTPSRWISSPWVCSSAGIG